MKVSLFTVLFVLLISAAAVRSASLSVYEKTMEVRSKPEENLVRILATQCRSDNLIPNQFKPNCLDFSKDFPLTYKNCFCHKKNESLGHYWCHCCDDRPVIGDMVSDLYMMDELDAFYDWAVEQSVQNIGMKMSDCQIVHVEDAVWENGASKAEDVKFDAEEKELFNFYNCDRSEDLEKFASFHCFISRKESHSRKDGDDDDYIHYGTTTLA